jgi:hypothetical protein
MGKRQCSKSSRSLVLIIILTGLCSIMASCGGGGEDYNFSLPLFPFWVSAAPPPPDTTPTTPTNFAATALSPSRIDLSWDASTDNESVTGYKIYRDGVFFSETNYPWDLKTLSYSVQKLDPSTQYCFTVSAHDLAGNESGMSNNSCSTTQPDLTPPTVPALLSDGRFFNKHCRMVCVDG